MSDIGLRNIQQDTLENILKENVDYEIPIFQREYSWGKDGWSDFLEDAIKAKEGNKKHFFGFMTFRQENEERHLIIEGQQRLTTVTILLALIRDIFYETSDPSWKVIERYINAADDLSPSDPPSFKLTLSELNKDFFQRYIQTVGNPNDKIEKIKSGPKLNLSNRNICESYKYFHSELNRRTRGLTDNERKTYFLEIVKVVLRNFIIIRTEVTDNKAAFNIFQTLNDRGLDLTITDIIKVYMFDLVGESWRDAKDKWDDIRETLSFQNTNSFFRHYWLSKYGIIKENELLNGIEKKIKNKSDVFRFLDELKDEAEYYEALLNPSKDFWGRKSEEIAELLEELQLLSKQQPLPLLMSSCDEDKFPTNEFIKLIRLCINFIFRYLTIAERENKELERLFSEMAIDIREGKIKNTKEIKARMLKAGVDNESFSKDFSKKQIKSAKVAKYILNKIENHIGRDSEKVAKKITLEHILPKTPDREWKEYLEKLSMDKDDYVYRLGNMTLLLEKQNREAQSQFFTKKRDKIYRNQTKLKINEELKDVKSWTSKDIEERQKRFAKFAIRIWSIDL
jgi:uncharacterized protein with ParB-like and HNH nuclease domain